MKALEFKSKIEGNRISIPEKIKSELNSFENHDVRIILLFEDNNEQDMFVKESARSFLEGYSESDSIYDSYQR